MTFYSGNLRWQFTEVIWRMSFNHFQIVASLLFALLLQSPVLAQGYSDYSANLPHGFEFVRCNHLETVICKSSIVVFSPLDHAGVGPIRSFSSSDSHLFLKNAGRKPRNLFPGDTFEDVDETPTFFFVISTDNGQVTGPLTEAQFMTHPAVVRHDDLQWSTPRHPMQYFIMAVFGSCVAIPMLLVGFLAWKIFRRFASCNTDGVDMVDGAHI